MSNHSSVIDTTNSLIALCKKNPQLRYVTIKAGYNGGEIYIFKYKRTTAKEGFTSNFWYAFITPDETVIVLGCETGRRTINYAYLTTYFQQETAAAGSPAPVSLQ
jgi:hypothetical protein